MPEASMVNCANGELRALLRMHSELNTPSSKAAATLLCSYARALPIEQKLSVLLFSTDSSVASSLPCACVCCVCLCVCVCVRVSPLSSPRCIALLSLYNASDAIVSRASTHTPSARAEAISCVGSHIEKKLIASNNRTHSHSYERS